MIATYRLQLTPDFGFDAVEALVPYFTRLGVSHLYLSPITEARAGSLHGYDVIDHNAIRADFGGREAFDRLRATAHRAGLQLILDFVPNHAGVGPNNAYWQDVLAYGPHSPYAAFFDIDWNPLKPELQGKILLPFLGRPYGEALDDGEIALAYEDGRFYAAYFENRFALAPATYARILEEALPHFERTDAYFDLNDLHRAYASLAPDEYDKAETLRTRLRALADRLDLAPILAAFSGPALHALLERQFWRLSYWKTAGYEINYRRFFDINELVALRMEDPQVFWESHRLLGELLAQEGVAGVRIDHIDGLFDPHGYLERLRELGADHIWVEKILAHGETLPEAWPVEGTTGYEFLNDVMGVLLWADGLHDLHRSYRRFVPQARSYEREVYRSKMLVMETKLSSELFRLAYELDRISEADYHTRDFTLEALREALAEIVAAFGRYRTYLPHDPEEAREVILQAVYRALQRNPAVEPTAFHFVGRVILGEVHPDLQPLQQAWTGRFQQYTAPVAAKGVEDTAFYRYLPLAALNEVGGEPDEPVRSRHAFHARARFRAHRYPRNLLATATHDHKRGEDTRMRLVALAEVPDLWQQTVQALDTIAADYRSEGAPSASDIYLFYQILAALWEDSDPSTLPDRLWAYLQKASRESKQQTSWLNPDDAYETALKTFVRGVTTDERTPHALRDLADELAQLGFANSISQLVLKLTTPGVPDLYQGTELLDLSLVDPDNRRPVDYARRQALLDELAPLLEAPQIPTLRSMMHARDPRFKGYVLARLLRLRGDHADFFEHAGYRDLSLEGPGQAHWIAFARETHDQALLVVVSRHPKHRRNRPVPELPMPDTLADYTWTEVLSGVHIPPTYQLTLSSLPLPWMVLFGR
ncbi:malto-oligosyltrehalose synthase [Rhodothermaceae bacterium RA]|nr:malto-oligosyltrehalose synthase [Rhodothermaceae bacterium RA]